MACFAPQPPQQLQATLERRNSLRRPSKIWSTLASWLLCLDLCRRSQETCGSILMIGRRLRHFVFQHRRHPYHCDCLSFSSLPACHFRSEIANFGEIRLMAESAVDFGLHRAGHHERCLFSNQGGFPHASTSFYLAQPHLHACQRHQE